MLFSYRKVALDTNEWISKQKENVNSIEAIASEAVAHDLNNGYYEDVDGSSSRTLEEDAGETYWSNNCFYVADDVFRIVIDGDKYLFDHMYITVGANPRIIVVAHEVPEGVDFWEDDQVKVLDNLENVYFVVEY